MSGLTGSWASAAVAIVAVAASATLTRDRCMGCPSEEWRAPSLVLVGTWERTLSKFRGADNREATGPFDTALHQRQQAMCFCGGVEESHSARDLNCPIVFYRLSCICKARMHIGHRDTRIARYDLIHGPAGS